MQELTTEQAKGLQVALHAEDASGPFSFPQASSLTKLKKAVSQAVGSALNVAQSPKSTVDRRNEANMSALGQILRSKYYRPSKVQVLSQMPCCRVTDEAAPFRSQAQQSSGRLLTSQYWQKESRQTGARTSSQRQRSHKAVTRSWKSKEGTCNDVGSTKISKQTMCECVL